jgi:hypothetical protein
MPNSIEPGPAVPVALLHTARTAIAAAITAATCWLGICEAYTISNKSQ